MTREEFEEFLREFIMELDDPEVERMLAALEGD